MLLWFVLIRFSDHVCHIWSECSACATKPNIFFACSHSLWSLVFPSGLLNSWIDSFQTDLYVLPDSLCVCAILNYNIFSKAFITIKIGTQCRRLNVYRYVSSDSWLKLRQRLKSWNILWLTNHATIQINRIRNIWYWILIKLIMWINLVELTSYKLSHRRMALIDFINLLQSCLEVSRFREPWTGYDPAQVVMQEAVGQDWCISVID
jgi:hypothetical protein